MCAQKVDASDSACVYKRVNANEDDETRVSEKRQNKRRHNVQRPQHGCEMYYYLTKPGRQHKRYILFVYM